MKSRVINSLYFFIFVFLVICAQAQDLKEFNELYNKINSRLIILKTESKDDTTKITEVKSDSSALAEIHDFMNFMKKFFDDEHKLNGKGKFEFTGNESNSSNLFKLGAGITIDHGIYPYQLDFSTQFKAVLKDGEFQENVSDIDISFDFFPIGLPDILDTSLNPPGTNQKKDSDRLWLENYLVLKRFNDDFLGIDQRYEIGAGIIFNHYTCGLTANGEKNKEELNKKSEMRTYGGDLIKYLEKCNNDKNILNLSKDEIETLQETKEAFKWLNKKKYSKLRWALLAGLYYEIEEAKVFNTIKFNNVDTLITEPFDITNKLRWKLRPTLAWQPKDNYILKIKSYFIFPFKFKDKISFGDSANKKTDMRYDIFIDFQSSLKIKVEENFTIGLEYRLLYDFDPPRKFLTDMNNMPVLLVGQNQHSSFGVSLEFDF